MGKVEHLVITGGEPFMQLDDDILEALSNYKIHVETNGSLPHDGLRSYIYHITCSPKQHARETVLEDYDDLKVLYPYQWDSIDKYKAPNRGRFLQPIFGDNTNQNMKDIIPLLDGDIRLSIQTHKYIGMP